jgi:hypothetical protein
MPSDPFCHYCFDFPARAHFRPPFGSKELHGNDAAQVIRLKFLEYLEEFAE